ncbi:hypothetical protein MKZ38_001062 [Zalerion maritima]|uniref:Uncharacterized protein n=1 Tax=Zalerion maritima TaxID=339359 RepID=A0AAD5RQR0_9PEZI|nr:hypothetical protein MKZ38_001062 [Zalerion maritima]
MHFPVHTSPLSDKSLQWPECLSISHALLDSPKWLSVDSDEWRVYGTPGSENIANGSVMGISPSLVWADDEGPASMDITLMVSKNPSPNVNMPVSRKNIQLRVILAAIVDIGQTIHRVLCRLRTRYVQRQWLKLLRCDGGQQSTTNMGVIRWRDLTFSGTTPPVETLDAHSEKVGLIVWIQIATSIVQSELRSTLNVAAGKYFDLNLDLYLMDSSVVQMSVTTRPVVDWVKFEARPRTISGTVLSSADGTSLELKIDVKSKTSSLVDSKTLRMVALNHLASQVELPLQNRRHPLWHYAHILPSHQKPQEIVLHHPTEPPAC